MGGAYGPNATNMRELTASRDEALSKYSTIGPPFVWAVPTVGNVIDTEALVTYLKWVRSAGQSSQLPLAVRRVYARCSGARRYRLSRRRLCVGRTRRAVVLAKPAYASQGQIDKGDANAY